jgi:hypothetical protein
LNKESNPFKLRHQGAVSRCVHPRNGEKVAEKLRKGTFYRVSITAHNVHAHSSLMHAFYRFSLQVLLKDLEESNDLEGPQERFLLSHPWFPHAPTLFAGFLPIQRSR